MDKGHKQCPRSLELDAPSEGEGTLGVSGDFDQMGSVWLRNTKESSMLAPVMMRPVTVALILCIESPFSAKSSSWPVMFSFSKNVGSDLEDLALLWTLRVIQGLLFPSDS